MHYLLTTNDYFFIRNSVGFCLYFPLCATFLLSTLHLPLLINKYPFRIDFCIFSRYRFYRYLRDIRAARLIGEGTKTCLSGSVVELYYLVSNVRIGLKMSKMGFLSRRLLRNDTSGNSFNK